MTIPPEMLRHLRHLEGYDRSLELDRMARLHGTTSEAIERLLQTEQPVEVSTVGPPTSEPRKVMPLEDGGSYRPVYDPSPDALSRQAMIRERILCSTCSAPLGIPEIRPIRITCPNCSNVLLLT